MIAKNYRKVKMAFKCTTCKKDMIPQLKSEANNQQVFYKTCECCRKKQEGRLAKAKKASCDLKKLFMPAFFQGTSSTKSGECFICFNEYEEGIKGIDCSQCKNSCCGNCHMKMFIDTKNSIKCSICRFQQHPLPFEGNKEALSLMTQYAAVLCGYNKEKSRQWADKVV